MSFFSVSFPLMTYLNYIFLLDVSLFTITDDEKEGQNQFFKYFWRISFKFEKMIRQVHKHSWLSITWILKKIELHTDPCWRHSTNQTLSLVSLKFTFDNWNSHYLEQFLCFILIITLVHFRFWVTKSQL